MSRPEQATVADVLGATESVAQRHDQLAELHRQAYDAAAPEESGQIESDSAESTALGH